MAGHAVIAAPSKSYVPVPLTGLAADRVPFALYLRTADDIWVLYHPAGTALDEAQLGRLRAEGATHLFVADRDLAAYFQRVEGSLDRVLLDRHLPLEQRADLLHGIAAQVADDLLAEPPNASTVARARRLMMATSSLILRERQGIAILRRVLRAGEGLAQHSLTVGFLSMSLSRLVGGADATSLAWAGMAGLLHDIGRVDAALLDDDAEHALHGADPLRGLALPDEVVAAVRWHHERVDGSGYPDGLRGHAIPELARVVGLVDAFDRTRAMTIPRLGVFDALCNLAQSYRQCFEPRLAQGLVRLFR